MMSFLWHPKRTVSEWHAASPYDDGPFARMLIMGAVYVILGLIVLGLVGAFVSSEIGYGNARCMFADCKIIYVRTTPR